MKKTQFLINENKVYDVFFEIILAVFPVLNLLKKNRKLQYEFSGHVEVNEK